MGSGLCVHLAPRRASLPTRRVRLEPNLALPELSGRRLRCRTSATSTSHGNYTPGLPHGQTYDLLTPCRFPVARHTPQLSRCVSTASRKTRRCKKRQIKRLSSHCPHVITGNSARGRARCRPPCARLCPFLQFYSRFAASSANGLRSPFRNSTCAASGSDRNRFIRYVNPLLLRSTYGLSICHGSPVSTT